MKPSTYRALSLLILGSCLWLTGPETIGAPQAATPPKGTSLEHAPTGSPRQPRTPSELEYWLENMVVHHGFSLDEVGLATGLDQGEIHAALESIPSIGRQPFPPATTESLKVLPYPGGRHPRIGFLEGAIRPQRETKISIFTPWDASSYVVADIPEAIWSNLGLTYLAHTHIPTIWDQANIVLPQLEWTRHEDGTLDFERHLPNGISFGTRVRSTPAAVRMEMWLRNGTTKPLTDLRVQNCVMLKGSPEFAGPADDRSVVRPPYATKASSDGRRWLITAWDPLDRVWANPQVPCLHSDPRFPDCAPGETVQIRGWLSFYEGNEIEEELARIEQTGWREKRSTLPSPLRTRVPGSEKAITIDRELSESP